MCPEQCPAHLQLLDHLALVFYQLLSEAIIPRLPQTQVPLQPPREEVCQAWQRHCYQDVGCLAQEGLVPIALNLQVQMATCCMQNLGTCSARVQAMLHE